MRAYLALILCLARCGDLPKDPEGTLERIRRDHVIRVGRVQGSSATDALVWRRILERLEASTKAKSIFKSGMLEPLLLDLEAGKLDAVVGGRFDEKTPWQTRVSLGPPIHRIEIPAGKTVSHIVMRNGKNAWIMEVQRKIEEAEVKP